MSKIFRRDHKNRNGAKRRVLLDPAQDLKAIHFGHHQVQQDRVYMKFGEKPESFFTTRREIRSVAARAQDVADQIKGFTIIVHDKDVIRSSSPRLHVLTYRLQKSRFLNRFYEILCC